MKKILFTLLILPIFCNAQYGLDEGDNKETVEEKVIAVEHLSYSDLSNPDMYKSVKNGQKIKSFEFKPNQVLKLSDTLIGGKAFNRNNTVKITQSGSNKSAYTTVMLGKFSIGGSILKGLPQQYPESFKENLIVYELKAYKIPRTKKIDVYVIFGVNGKINSKGIYKCGLSCSKGTITDLNKSLDYGEIINPRAPLSRDEAIKKLKESKDLLELDVISKEEYEAIRKELIPIIKK